LLYLYHVNTLTFYEVVDQITVGRTTGDIVFAEDGRMSGKHAQITLETSDPMPCLYVQDLGSKNFTIINRIEIEPHKKTKLKTLNMIEIGDQRFVVTESKDVHLQDLSEMTNKLMSKPILKFGPEEEVATARPVQSITPYEQLQRQEAQIIQLKGEISAIEQVAKGELIKLEETKEKIIVKAKAKRQELANIISALQSSMIESKAQMAIQKAEIEQKKKKIINLKDLPTEEENSTEDLPE
jgi:pSer/pThr/pTyr-binding forkhead associated (FHA) protein